MSFQKVGMKLVGIDTWDEQVLLKKPERIKKPRYNRFILLTPLAHTSFRNQTCLEATECV
jgi:hypothetical protein